MLRPRVAGRGKAVTFIIIIEVDEREIEPIARGCLSFYSVILTGGQPGGNNRWAMSCDISIPIPKLSLLGPNYSF